MPHSTSDEHAYIEFIPPGKILHIPLPAEMKEVCGTKCSASSSPFPRNIVIGRLVCQKHSSVLRFLLVSVRKEYILYAVGQR